VTVCVFCLFHTASKFTQSYHFGAKKIFIWGRGPCSLLLHTPPLSASTAPHPLNEILETPLIGFVRPAQNEAVKLVFQLVEGVARGNFKTKQTLPSPAFPSPALPSSPLPSPPLPLEVGALAVGPLESS